MKVIILACFFGWVMTAPHPKKDAQILKDDRVLPEGGAYTFDFETENGIKRFEGGQPEGENQAIHSTGVISFPLPNGEVFELKFVANDQGYQPESSFLPVAPEFPHPIPQFVLDQIEHAEKTRQQEPLN